MGVNAPRRYYEVYESLSDEDIVEMARENDNIALEFLINKYKNFVRAKA
ncbi:MAG: RNA polymerase sporulation sigma factor SigH, partial [Firmicutes bacterium]|nr:RNA polymerase sporulation sigma factor SigH [Bacillota bacterium]